MCDNSIYTDALHQETTKNAGIDRVVSGYIEGLDAVFRELIERGWVTLPDGHGVATIRDVFVEAHVRAMREAVGILEHTSDRHATDARAVLDAALRPKNPS